MERCLRLLLRSWSGRAGKARRLVAAKEGRSLLALLAPRFVLVERRTSRPRTWLLGRRALRLVGLACMRSGLHLLLQSLWFGG